MTSNRRVFISADLEGVAGVVASEELRPGNAEYETARRLMTSEVNAAIRGIIRASPDAEILVADSHGTYRNIVALELDSRASLLRGKPRQLAMVEGVREGDGVMFIGYHSRAGTTGTLSHTFSDVVRDIRCDGQSLGEGGLNMAVISQLGATLLLTSGNDVFTSEIQALSSKVRAVTVSTAVSASAAVSVHPDVACDLIEEAARAATNDWDGGTLRLEAPLLVEVDFHYPGHADSSTLPPPVTRIGPTSIQLEAADMADAYRWIRTVVSLASQPFS